MTQEQKAQRYDEAIDIARKINSGEGVAAPSGWTICDYIFPELKENEDEKIRKELIDIVTKSPITFAFEDKEKVLAWLEKQGEHANFRNKIQIGDKVTRNEDGVLVNMSQLKRVAKKDEKYGEQKPLFKKGDAVFWDGEEFNILDVTKDSYDVGGYIIPICRQNELLLKQKSARGEEDEGMLNDIIHNIHFAETHRNVTGSSAMEKEQVNWLISLKQRYTWKPSEGQMKALAEAISLAKNCGEESSFDLQTLYEQLRKLKG